MVFIGMNNADKRLLRYPHLYDRFVEVYKFQPLDRDDVEKMTRELSEVQFTEELVDRVATDSEGKIRKIIAYIHRAEHFAHVNKGKTITVKDLK
jgi:DNA polymerase III delta prime subunit